MMFPRGQFRFIYLFIYDELVKQYTEKYKEKKIKQMNIEYDYDCLLYTSDAADE